MTRTTKKVPNPPESSPKSGDIEPFFSLQSVPQPAVEADQGIDLGEEEPTIRDRIGEIPAFHSLNLPSVGSEVESSGSGDGEPTLDTQAETKEVRAAPSRPAAGSQHTTSDDWSSTSSNPVADSSTGLDDTWTEFESADDSLILSSDSMEEEDASGGLDDSLEWDRSLDEEAPLLTPSTTHQARVFPAAAEPEPVEPTEEDPASAVDPGTEEDSASVSIDVEILDGYTDPDLADPAGDTVKEAYIPERLSGGVDEQEPSGEFVSGAEALVQEGIDALNAGDRDKALSCFEGALRSDPDHATAVSYLELVHEMIIREYFPQASLQSVPRLRVGREMLMTLELDPNAGGVLAMIDGVATLEDLEAMLPYFDRESIYSHLAEAYQAGLIEFDT